jgi:hypothetical protein
LHYTASGDDILYLQKIGFNSQTQAPGGSLPSRVSE